jgi:putative DNA primase/helicase
VKKQNDLKRTNKHYADQFCRLYLDQKSRFCEKWETWLVWDGKRWKENSQHMVLSYFDNWAESLSNEYAESKGDLKEQTRIHNQQLDLSSISGQRRILEYATRRLLIEPDQLDQHNWLLNFNNGTVDLRTGQLRPHQQSDYLTKLINFDYDPSAIAPRWNQFLLEIMQDSVEMAEFLQVVSGYGATGSVREQALFMFYGVGANGKSTFCETVLELISDYSESVTHDFFAHKRVDSHMTAIADMAGKRYVVGSEFTGNRLDEPLVKRLTGGDTIKARRMRQDYFQFKPTHSFFILVNDKPKITGTDRGIWRRMKLVPFLANFEDNPDEDLKEKLLAEAEGVLAWLVEGAVKWFEDGVHYPAQVLEAGQEYQADMDSFGQFLKECTESDQDSRIKSSSLLEYYHQWCDMNGFFFKGDAGWVKKEMEQRGQYTFKRSGGSKYVGLRFRPDILEILGRGGQMGFAQTYNSQGNGQGGQQTVLSTRETIKSLDNGFLLSNCPNSLFFEDLEHEEKVDIIISMSWSAGMYRQDLPFSEFAAIERHHLLDSFDSDGLLGEYESYLEILELSDSLK